MNRRLLAMTQSGLLLSAALMSGCSSENFPVVPTPVATSAVVLQGNRYQGNMTLASGATTSFNMTLIARGLSEATRVMSAAQTTGTLSLTGNFETGNGLTGTVQGTVAGTLENGSFNGSLTANSAGHADERQYSGPITTASAAWVPGDCVQACTPDGLTGALQVVQASPTAPNAPPPPPACSYTISPTSASFPSNGGTGSTTVTAASNCSWTAESLATWINIVGGATGTGVGTVTFTVQVNPGAPRQGSLRIAGQTFTVTETPQPSTPPRITTQPQSQTIASGATAGLSVTATGTSPLSYQWYVGPSPTTTNPIAGATASTYTTPALAITMSYWVRVANTGGSADSTTATISVAITAPDPSFVQPPQTPTNDLLSRSGNLRDDLVARIDVPSEGSLVRANVPIFGVATGSRFKEFRLEYGKGEHPSVWIPIQTSTVPQVISDLSQIDASADLTISGNLGTWDTGLKGYVYLPSHPADHPVDLRGIYTIRLVVVGHDGSVAEDRTTVEVGEAVSNAWGATVRSDDDKVTLAVPGQALTEAFRVMAIRRLEHPPETLTPLPGLSGHIYQVREAGEQLLKPATLEMPYEKGTSAPMTLVRWDPFSLRWMPVVSKTNAGGTTIAATVSQLSPYYAVATAVAAPSEDPGRETARSSGLKSGLSYLIRDTFEEDMGEWSNRDGEFGADVTLDTAATSDGTKALRISRRSVRGTFAVNVLRDSFDAKEFPIVQFDYRIAPGVRTDFLAHVSGRWYLICFTGTPRDFAFQRVNIANIGSIDGVRTDDRWHTAQFNLLDLLLTRTSNTVVDELIMADWEVGGFMRLHLSSAPRDTGYHIDNFQIRRDALAGRRVGDESILIDNFNHRKHSNGLGSWSTYQDAQSSRIQLAFPDTGCDVANGCLALTYSLPAAGSFGGAIASLEGLDLRGYHSLRMRVRADRETEDLVIGIKDRLGREGKVRASRFLGRTLPMEWTTLEIPLVAFTDVMTWSTLENLSLSVERNYNSQGGDIFVDDIEVRRSLSELHVEDFEAKSDTNSLQRRGHTITAGAVAINGSYSAAAENRFYRVSYGGNIGAINSLPTEIFSYGGWATELGGINCSQCGMLSFRVRGAEGDEKPNIYLSDGNFRWGVDIEKYAVVKASWTTVAIPLEDFSRYGVDLTHLTEIQFVFEWEKMAGTIFLDDIRFGAPNGPPISTHDSR